jgi:hypothetical protein
VKLTSAVELQTERYFSGRNIGADTVTINQEGRTAARVEPLLSGNEPDLIRHADSVPGGHTDGARPIA